MPQKENKVIEAAGAVNYLCRRLGVPPSVSQIAEQAGEPVGSTFYHLQKALDLGLIAQREGKYMSLSMAKAWKIDEEE